MTPMDHPDGVRPVSVSRADIKLPIDFQKQTLNLAIDIVAQTIATISINIEAQKSGLNLNVNIAASAATLTVNVSGTAAIDITAQSVAVFTKADWEVKEGNQKYLRGGASMASHPNAYTLVTYAVPAGKTLYVYGYGLALTATNAVDGDKAQHGACTLVINTSDIYIVGGDGGNTASFSCPIKVTAGQTAYLVGRNGANHSLFGSASLLGFEV